MHGGRIFGPGLPWRRVWPGSQYAPYPIPPSIPQPIPMPQPLTPLPAPSSPPVPETPANPPPESDKADGPDAKDKSSKFPAEKPVDKSAEESVHKPTEKPQELPTNGQIPEHTPLPDGWQSPNYPHPPRVPGNNAFGDNPIRPCLQPGARGLGGKATYYTEWSHNPGSCGYIPGYDNIVAVAPQHMPHSCGRCILVRYQGRVIKAVVTDTCMACEANTKWIDLSSNMFSRFASHDLGVLQVDWDFVEC